MALSVFANAVGQRSLRGKLRNYGDALSLPAGACATIPKLTLLLEDLNLGVAVPYSGTLYGVPHECHPVAQDEQDTPEDVQRRSLYHHRQSREQPEESHRNALLGRGQVRHGRRIGRQLGLRFPAAADRLFTQHHTSPIGMARELFAMTSASPPPPSFLSLEAPLSRS